MKALFAAVVLTGSAMAAAGVVFATREPLPAVPAPTSCPASTAR